MLAYNVAASQIARPNLQIFLFKIKENGSTYIDWHQERNEMQRLDNATRDNPSHP